MEKYLPSNIDFTKYLFFTGKGGVGKTTVASSTAVNLAKAGHQVILVSIDPASNLQDVFETELSNQPKEMTEVAGLFVVNFDPSTAAEEYKNNMIEPYRELLPQAALDNMAEQLSGSCTVEVASFNEFANFLTEPEIEEKFDYIIFDTAPTGHTLRMLQLPSAWTSFFDENTTGTSCMGQLSGLGDERERYQLAVETLADARKTTLMLVTRAQEAAVLEANRASIELRDIGVENQKLIVNGLLENYNDQYSEGIYKQQLNVFEEMPQTLKEVDTYSISLNPHNLTGVKSLEGLFDEVESNTTEPVQQVNDSNFAGIDVIVDDFISSNKEIIFTMGKGGVGKTTVAIDIAEKLVKSGKKVHLATTDPANHLKWYVNETPDIRLSYIDETLELQKYKDEMIEKASKNAMSEDDLAYVKEDLESPCTQEIAVFRKFAEIIDDADDEIVVMDTAPTGHTLLLLESSQSYALEVERSTGEVPESINRLLPRLQNKKITEIVMVTLPEQTPVLESMRLSEDLDRAGIAHTWWLINQSMYMTDTTNDILRARANNELPWIEKVAELSKGSFAVAQWELNHLEKNIKVTV